MAMSLSVKKQTDPDDSPLPTKPAPPKAKMRVVPAAVKALQRKVAEAREEGKPVRKKAKRRAIREAAIKKRKHERVLKRVAPLSEAKQRFIPLCACGSCNEPVQNLNRKFLRGHYGRYIGSLKMVVNGDLAWDELPEPVRRSLKTTAALKAVVDAHDTKVQATKKKGGSKKTKWLHKRNEKAARLNKERAARRAAKKQ
jgi:hypothetical protein